MTTRFILFVWLTLSCIVSFAQAEVNSLMDLKQAIIKAKPGDKIILSEVTFENKKCDIEANGTSEKPIIIKAKTKGGTFITSSVEIKGDYIHIDGVNFIEKGNLVLSGRGCRVSNCTWDDSKSGKWLRVLPGSSEIEIHNNIFKNKITSNQNMDRNCQLLQIIVRNRNEKHHIHHNLFKDVAKGKTGNGFETLQLITENNPFDPPPGDCNTVIEDNLFIRCNGEAEIISVKSNGNLIRKNTFRACRGGLVLRHGDNNVVTQNYLFGEGEEGSAGVRLQGTGQMVANNYFQDLGSYGLGMMDGTPDDLYIRVENARIVFNTFINCNNNFTIGINHSKHPNGTVPKNCRIEGNIFYSEDGNTSEEFVVFVQNDQPENWQWKDNIGFGKKSPEMTGFLNEDPKIKKNSNGLRIPTSGTKSSRITNDFNEIVKSDLFGNNWKMNRTVGAIQFPIESNNNKPLTEKEFENSF